MSQNKKFKYRIIYTDMDGIQRDTEIYPATDKEQVSEHARKVCDHWEDKLFIKLDYTMYKL